MGFQIAARVHAGRSPNQVTKFLSATIDRKLLRVQRRFCHTLDRDAVLRHSYRLEVAADANAVRIPPKAGDTVRGPRYRQKIAVVELVAATPEISNIVTKTGFGLEMSSPYQFP